jgi:replicative DNA helicase
MKTLPTDDLISLVAERAIQRDIEKFKQETFEYARKQREAKERKAKEAEQPVEFVVSES